VSRAATTKPDINLLTRHRAHYQQIEPLAVDQASVGPDIDGADDAVLGWRATASPSPKMTEYYI